MEDPYRSDDMWVKHPLPEPFTAPEPRPLPTGPIHPRSGTRERLRRIAAPFAGAAALALKFFAKFKLLLVALPKLKLAGTMLTAIVSIGAYALFWGWEFAAVFVLLLFVHEMGHVLWLRHEGVPATAPLFIPFLGAVVGMKGMPKDAYVEAKVGLAGPILGSLGAAAVWFLGVELNSQMLQAVAYFGFLLNLFNLLPVVPLDGGRAMAAVHPLLWGVGLVGLVGLFVWRPNVILLLILFFGGREAWSRYKNRRSGNLTSQSYYRVTARQRWLIGTVYLGLAAVLVLAMHAAQVPRPS